MEVVVMLGNVYNELMKRYTYLYENRELILSFGINKAIEMDKINKDIKELEYSKKTLKKYKYVYGDNYEEIIKLFDMMISDCQNALKEPKYYLFDKIDDDLVMMFEEFLISDLSVEETRLYGFIERIKDTSELLNDVNIKIDGLLERRKNNRFLKDKDVFTVWRILTYVRNNNLGNDMILKVLDRYYNLDRYIRSGINFNSGYYFLEIDEIMYNEILNEQYLDSNSNNFIIGGVRNDYERSMIVVSYDGNEFEKEDEYFTSEWVDKLINDDVDIESKNDKKSKFVDALLLGGMLSIDDKEEIYSKIHSRDNKVLRRVNLDN